FEANTLKDLAENINKNTAQNALKPIQNADRTQHIPLSYAQERLWFVDKLDPAARAVYRIDGALRLKGALDTQALRAAFDAVVDRHESLRSSFQETEQGTVNMDIMPDAKAIGFAVEQHKASEGLEGIVEEFLNWPYNLARGPLFRAMLLEVGPEDHILAVGGHHAILDGWSVALLFNEVAAYYRAFMQDQIAQVAPMPVQFGDYAAWQRELFSNDTMKVELDWWREALTGAPEAITLPTDRPRPEIMDYRGRSVRAHVPHEAMQAIVDAARDENATLFMGLEAGLAAYLMRLGAGEDVVIGTAVAGRPLPELDPMVGFFINTLALRNKVTPDQTLQEQIRHARDVTLNAFDHQHVPFDAVIDALRPTRSMRHAPVVQVMLILQNIPRASEVLDLGGLDVEYFGDRMAEKGAQFDMAFEFAETADGLEAILTYSTALFDDASAQRLLDGFANFLTAGAQAPQKMLRDLPVMQDDVLETLTQFQDGGEIIAPPTLLPELIAQADPKARAVTDETGNWLTYGELHTRAEQIGAAMQAAGIKPNTVVGICVSRTPDLPAAMLAAWKIGAAFVPFNPNDPTERQQYMLSDAGAIALVMDNATDTRVADLTQPKINVDALPTDMTLTPATGHLAYVLFTSGSTGKPKGVAVSQSALAHLNSAIMQDGPMTPNDCLISGFETTFDVFVRDVALTLASGAGLVLAQPRNLLKPGHYTQLVETHGGTWLQLTPTVWRVALAEGWRPAKHMRAEAGGEAMDAELAALLGQEGATVVNAYGPTEVTAVSIQGYATQDDIDVGGPIPIGTPLPGIRAYVLDQHLRQVPPGVPGELVLAGPQVADGYVGHAAQTAEAFIVDPFVPNARAYRTGDLVRWLADGRLMFLGRIDGQVKIRGMRVELSEIETAISKLPKVAAAAVATRKDTQGQTRLIAYLTSESGPGNRTSAPDTLDLAPFDAGEIRAELAKTLPEHMIPQTFARLSHLPLMPSGKLDRKALPEVKANLAQADYVALEGPMEELVADEIAKLLGENSGDDTTLPERIGRHDGFFALGGHSLLAVQLVKRLEGATGLNVPLKAIFDSGDIAQLAANIDAVLDGELPGAEAEVDDARKDIALVDKLPNAPDGDVPTIANAQTILLTGVTGFLGRYLLRDLLKRSDADIICVVRGKDAHAARTRVLDALTSIPGETLPTGFEARVKVALGELSRLNLGLSSADRSRIAADVDLIVHNGAEVHAMKPYASLRASNTMSVLDLLHLMSMGRPKAMTFVSTLGTLEVGLDKLTDGFDPDVMTPAEDSGYNLSKWAAERILITARDKGYHSTILRPGLIIGDQHTGYYDTSDIGRGYTALFVGTGSVPNAMSSFAMPWINVDRASQMILDLTETAPKHGIGHVFDYGAMPSDVLAKALDVDVVPAKAWLDQAVTFLDANPDHTSSWLLPRLRGQAADLEGVPDEMIPVENANSMFERYAPPPLPDTLAPVPKPEPVDGLIPSVKWLTNRNK
ncbi:MAG: amino acid adenylation domain-containing protein, partial [Paracoccaceae bacterium]